MAEWLINKTTCEEAERFIRAKVEEAGYSASNLRCFMKWSAGKEQVAGYCRYPRKPLAPEMVGVGPESKKKRDKKLSSYTISARVKNDVRFPVVLHHGVGTWQKNINGGKHWGFFYQEEKACSYDELMVWIVAHELWHFLCKTKQEKGNYQTKANAFGFKWMREFKQRR